MQVPAAVRLTNNQKGIRSEGVNGSEGWQWIKQTLYLYADILAIILILVRVTQ